MIREPVEPWPARADRIALVLAVSALAMCVGGLAYAHLAGNHVDFEHKVELVAQVASVIAALVVLAAVLLVHVGDVVRGDGQNHQSGIGLATLWIALPVAAFVAAANIYDLTAQLSGSLSVSLTAVGNRFPGAVIGASAAIVAVASLKTHRRG